MTEKRRVNWNWIKKNWLFLLPSLIWIGILAVTTILWSDNRISSDWSAELILARELLREKKLITDTWHYSTEIRILYTQLLAMPLFCLFHSWDVIRAGQGCLLHLLLLLTYCFCMKGTKISPKWVYLSSVFLFIPFSYIYIDIVRMGQSYQPHMILSFLIVGLYLRLTEHRSIPAAVFLILLSFLCGLSGIRYLQILSLPVLLLCLCLTGIHTLSMLAQNDENSDRKKAADFLQENDVTFGYATFWNADVITELTDGEVNVASISSCDPFTVYDWLMPERYLEKGILEEGDGNQVFLLLTWEEYEEYRDSPVVQEAGEPVYTADGYMILFYDKQSFWKTYIETTDNGDA